MKAGKTYATTLLIVLAACKGDDNHSDAPDIADVPAPTPANSQTVVPLFGRPFIGTYPLFNYFDHDRPEGPGANTGGYQLTWRGERAIPGVHHKGYDSHTGYDWEMPTGTPLLAMADGVVFFAGWTAPSYCALQNENTTALVVSIAHRAPNGNLYGAHYLHMSRIDVSVDQRVTAGQQIGLSGATGCVGRLGTPHLHLAIYRDDTAGTNSGNDTLVDPYGWEGAGADPWSMHPSGAESVWLWKPGEAPSLVR